MATIDERLIKRFLSYLNAHSKLIKVKRIGEKKDSIIPTITFEATIEKDYFVDGGIINFSENYYDEISRSAKMYFNTEPHFNNTGSIFWIHLKI
jgi:5-methylcytosine-specific restriction endonuclease McrBC regulatory subunit McrC